MSTCPFVHPFVHYQTCEYSILKTSELILMPVSTIGPQGKGMKQSTLGVRRSSAWNDLLWGSGDQGHETVRLWGSGDQVSVSREPEDKFEGLAEESFSTPL